MNTRLTATGVFALAITCCTVSAQEINPLVRERIQINSVTSSQSRTMNQQVRVQVGINFFIPGPAIENEESTELRDRARRMIYQMAVSECELVQQVFAATCRLDAINVNVNRQHGGQTPGFMVGGSIVLMTTLK